MRKTIKRPDGTEEVIEGTPEEIAEYTRRINGDDQQKKPEVLKDNIERLKKILGDPPDAPAILPEQIWPGIYAKPIWIVSCSICRRIGCNGNCWNPDWSLKITCTSNTGLGDNVVIVDPKADRYS